MRVLRIVAGVCAIGVVVCFAPAALRAVNGLSFSSRSVVATAAGAAAFFLIWYPLRRRLQFFLTLEHEATHLLTGLFFLKWPRRLHVHETEGGFVETYGSNFVVSLTPYFVPTPALLLLAVGLAVDRRHTLSFMVLYGASLSYHVISTFRETHMQQPDVRRWGTAFSLLIIIAGNILIFGMCLAFINGGYSGVTRYFEEGGRIGRNLWLRGAALFG
jgi:hypothetical protein